LRPHALWLSPFQSATGANVNTQQLDNVELALATSSAGTSLNFIDNLSQL